MWCMRVCREARRVGFGRRCSELDQFEIIGAIGTTQLDAREETDERVHGVGQRRATQNTQGVSRHAQLQHQQDSWSVCGSLTEDVITCTTDKKIKIKIFIAMQPVNVEMIQDNYNITKYQITRIVLLSLSLSKL